MFDDAIGHVENTWTNVIQGNSTLGEKLEFAGEAGLGVAALGALGAGGLARYASAAEAALPRLDMTAQPAIEKAKVFAIESENYFEEAICLFSRACGKTGEMLGRARFVNAGSAQTADELVAQISKGSQGRPLKEVLIESHGNVNATLSLAGEQPYYPLGEIETQRAFKSLNMTSDSRLTFLGCKMAGGPCGVKDLQDFANSTGIRTRAFKWLQWSATEGFGPYVEAIPGQAQTLEGYRVNWDALLYPVAVAAGGTALIWAKKKASEISTAFSTAVKSPDKL